MAYLYSWKFLLVFFLLAPATNAASLEISKVNNAQLIRQFEELSSLKGKPIQEVQPALSKAAQSLLTYLAPKIKHLDGFNTTFVINCTVPFDSNGINNIKCNVDFSAIDPGNQTDPNALILRENIRELRHNNIFLTRSFLNCSSGEYLSGTNGIYFEQPWDWTRTASQSRIERSKTGFPTISDSETLSETETKTASISNTQTPQTISNSVSNTSNIWSISSCQELQNMQQNLNGNYILTQDIDCSGTKNWNNRAGFVPMGTFGGIIDGNNYTISNLYINKTNNYIDNTGLFFHAVNTAVIKNIKLINVVINSIFGTTAVLISVNEGAQVSNVHITGNITTDGRGYYTAGLIGWNRGGKTINSSFVGIIDTNNDASYVGGLVGANDYNPITKQLAAIISSYADVNIIHTKTTNHSSNVTSGLVAGLAGSNAGIIIDSYATGTINGDANIGGLAGDNNFAQILPEPIVGSGTILNSHASVTVNGTMIVGGLIGALGNGFIQNSSATGNVSGNIYIGGLVGRAYCGVIQNSYATGNVNGDDYIGGLVGGGNGVIQNSYATGNASGDDYVGGLVGKTYNGIIQNSYATGNTEGNNTVVGGLVGLNLNGTVKDSSATGNVSGNDYIGGLVGYSSDGVISNSYATGNVNGNAGIGGLIGSIDSECIINNSSAIGNAEGNIGVGGLVGFTWNCTIKDSFATGNASGNVDIGGLIGGVTNGSVNIKNSFAIGNVSGDSNVGGLAGLVWNSTINNSSAAGSVNGDNNIGGLVGLVLKGSVIQNSYATGKASGDSGVGGLMGNIWNNCTINDSYSIGKVTGNFKTGGLIGSNTYSSNNITSSYWNTETSGQQTSAGGQGEATEEMMQKSTYVGWDFDNVWEIKEGESYPTLRWQKTKN